MKKISLVCIAGVLFFTACDNEGSSTVGSYDKEETATPSETKENEAKEAGKNENMAADTSENSAGMVKKDTTTKRVKVQSKTTKADLKQ